jgi:hypothetical protein
MNRLACSVLALAGLAGCAQSPASGFDFSLVAPPSVERRKLAQPVVQWLTHVNAAAVCAQMTAQDGFAVWQEGCVAWSVAKSTCTIVTTASTNHSQVGRLFLLCLTGGEPS